MIAVIASFGVAATAAAQQATTTTFTSNKATINDQETATLTVRVSCPTTCATTPLGSVVMLDLTTGETTTVVSLTADPFNAFRSIATIPWSGAFITLGGHVLRATYNGNASFASSVAPTITQTVLKTWALSVNIVGSGSATVGGVAAASGGVVRVTDAVSQTIVATPAAGFHLASHAYDCSGSTTLSDGLANVAITITSAFTSNCTLMLTFTNTRTISVAALGGISGVFVGLTVPPSTSAVTTVNVIEGGTVNIVGSPQNAAADLLSIADPEGVTKFFMGNGEIYGGVGSMTITNVVKSRVVSLTFVATTRVPVLFQVGVGAFGGGTAQVPINQNVRSQAQFASFTGFFPSVITGDCPTPSGLPWALSDIVNSKITTNIIVGGCFVRVDFSTVINATAGAGGQVSPASRTVMSPSNPTFTLTPDAGFSVGTMGGTCSGSLAGNTYTAFVRGVQCTVIANFNPRSRRRRARVAAFRRPQPLCRKAQHRISLSRRTLVSWWALLAVAPEHSYPPHRSTRRGRSPGRARWRRPFWPTSTACAAAPVAPPASQWPPAQTFARRARRH